jgi:hypothetical protein
MAWRVCPVIQGYWANVYAHAVSGARVPVDGNIGSMYAHLLRWFYGSPDFVSVVFTYNFSVLLKIRVYRQKVHLSIIRDSSRILGFLSPVVGGVRFLKKHISVIESY